MPSVTLNLYDKFREGSFDGNDVNFESDTIKMSLHTNTYTPNQNTDDFFNDATNEVSGTGYTAGGNILANGTVTVNGSGLVTVDLDDPAVWSQDAGGFSNARHIVIYKDTGVSTTSRLVAYGTMASDQGNVAGDFTVTLNASGLFTSAR